ncbi:MAG: PspC domain-containing protein [Novosphingobium sp.]
MNLINHKKESTMGNGAFRLNKSRGKLMGVSAGLADYTGWDVTLIRVAWVAGTLLGFGSLLIVYLAIGFIAD